MIVGNSYVLTIDDGEECIGTWNGRFFEVEPHYKKFMFEKIIMVYPTDEYEVSYGNN